MSKLASQEDAYEIPEQEDGKPKSALTSSKLKDVKDGKIPLPKVAQEIKQLEQTAKAEMEEMLRDAATGEDANTKDIKNLGEELEYQEQRIKFCKTPGQAQDVLREIDKIKKRRAKEKIDEKAQAEKAKEKLNINDPLLQKEIKKFGDICDKNTHLIGGGKKGAEGYKAWFKQELAANPTIKFAQQKIDEFEGTIPHPRGLAPRRENYQALDQLCKKYSFGSPLKSPFIKQNGLDERRNFLKEAKETEEKIRQTNDQYWPPKAKRETMQEVLMAKNPGQLKELRKKIEDIHKIETDGFIRSKISLTINGISVKKMSDASITMYIDSLRREGSIDGRLNYLTGNGKLKNGLVEAVDNEGSLFEENVKPQVAKDFGIKKGLAGIYKDNPDGFKLAVKSFEKLDFMKKIQALKNHKKLVEKAENKEDIEKKLKVMEAHAEINESARKKDIAACTQKTYKDWFSNESNYKNQKTDKPGDLETLKKFVDILTSDTINKKSHNLEFYAAGRRGFKHLLKETKKNDPKFDKAIQKKWQNDYDSKGWTDKTKVYDKLKDIYEKSKGKKTKAKFLEAANDNNDTKETKEKLTLEQTIASALQLLADNQPEEAKNKLFEYVDNLPEGKPVPREIWNLMKLANKEANKKGKGKKLEETEEKQVEEEVKTIAKNDEKIKDKIEEANLVTLNLEGTRQSEDRHQKTVSGQNRAKKESIARAKNQLEEDLTEDFYKQTDDKHILNKEGTGEKITEIKFDRVDMTNQERQKLKGETRKHKNQLFNEIGFTHFEKKDKSGKIISTEQAENKQATQLEQLENELTEKALKKTEKRSGKNDKSIFNLNTRVAAKRKSKELLNKERHSHERLSG